MVPEPGRIRIEVVLALPEEQLLLALEVPEGCTALEAFERSGIARRFPQILAPETSAPRAPSPAPSGHPLPAFGHPLPQAGEGEGGRRPREAPGERAGSGVVPVLGVFGKVLENPADQVLADGDRVEVYRPLAIDPRDARRRRARKAR